MVVLCMDLRLGTSEKIILSCLYVSYNKSLRKIWHLPPQAHTDIVMGISGCIRMNYVFAIHKNV